MAKWRSGAALMMSMLVLSLTGCDLIKERFGGHAGSPPAAAAPAAATTPAAAQRPARPAVDETQVLAWVNNEPVTIAEFTQHRDAALQLARNALQHAPESEKAQVEANAKTLDTKKGLLKQLVDEELLYQDALARNLDRDPEVQEVLRTVKRNALLQKARQRLVEHVQVDAAAVAQFYEANKAYFKEPDKVQLRVIVVATEAEAKSLMTQLYGGADFAETARQQSLHESKARGGEFGPVIKAQDAQFLQQQNLPASGQTVFPALETLIFAEGLSAGSYTTPVQGPDGHWWIALVTSKEAGRQKQLVEVQDSISEYLKTERYQQAARQYLDELENQAKNEGHLTLYESKLEQIQ